MDDVALQAQLDIALERIRDLEAYVAQLEEQNAKLRTTSPDGLAIDGSYATCQKIAVAHYRRRPVECVDVQRMSTDRAPPPTFAGDSQR
jgi:hypothetical protein